MAQTILSHLGNTLQLNHHAGQYEVAKRKIESFLYIHNVVDLGVVQT